jgi:hypothetical protein
LRHSGPKKAAMKSVISIFRYVAAAPIVVPLLFYV